MNEQYEWWGFSAEQGWVVLDRSIATNRPRKAERLVFLRCRDWVHYEDDRGNWNPPHYIFSERYLETLGENSAAVEREVLASLKAEYQIRKVDFYSSVVQERHRRFLNNAGRSEVKTVKARKRVRVSHCWNCKQPVDNSIDLECSACGWIICGSCGACGCTYGANTSIDTTAESVEGLVGCTDETLSQSEELPSITGEERVFSSFGDASKYAKENPGSKLSRTTDGNSWRVESA